MAKRPWAEETPFTCFLSPGQTVTPFRLMIHSRVLSPFAEVPASKELIVHIWPRLGPGVLGAGDSASQGSEPPWKPSFLSPPCHTHGNHSSIFHAHESLFVLLKMPLFLRITGFQKMTFIPLLMKYEGFNGLLFILSSRGRSRFAPGWLEELRFHGCVCMCGCMCVCALSKNGWLYLILSLSA